MKLARLEATDLSDRRKAAVLELWQSVWPQKGATERSFEQRFADRWSPTPGERESEAFHLVELHGELAAVSRSFAREIAFLDGERREKVLALASVCSDPALRGKGYGRLVVEDAFARMREDGFRWCLFQTGVPDFYRKLGAKLVQNRFVNSFSSQDPEASPWWDAYVMVYGEVELWLEGRVDLRGPGY
ncbi:GNAT family N-acetyltransferase [Pelagicoccus sp. SDUM812003]|uniref:GNAT family N-acetyltransferase n=1 Tax=Pelagicoccus sp. SDUM812003 TaxID=3041267 RepID=UPI00280D2F35|nr:GNAT family N-acetyltransferase [Pelagicoccus sp. SDUM812003]MDQ8205329.1 GNAT family N-acetyltransferase [Pelagicoccus sp. SDUM812003]